MSSKPRIIACPRCGKPVEWTPAAQFRPFCSERCKTRDLGAWASEEYRVPGEPLPDGGSLTQTHPEAVDDA